MMKIKLVLVLLTMLAVLFGSPNITWGQGGGCPTHPTPNSAVQYQVVESIDLAPAFPETVSSKTPGVFFEGTVNLVYQPDWRMILSSTPDGGGALCSDDLVKIQSSPGLIFEHDFRSADRSRIVPLEPLDVTGLFKGTGEHSLQVSLVDLTPPQFSSSPYYLIIVEASSTASLPPKAEVYQEEVVATATALPTSSPTVTPTVPPTNTPMATATATATVTHLAVIPAVEPSPAAPPNLGSPVPRWLLPISLLALSLTGFILLILRQSRLVGVLVITKDGQPWRTIDLARYRRRVTVGRKGRIRLEDDEDQPTIPNLWAVLFAQRDQAGRVQVMWQPLTEEDETNDIPAYPLTHGHVEEIGPYRIVYKNFSEQIVTQHSFEGGIWNDVEL